MGGREIKTVKNNTISSSILFLWILSGKIILRYSIDFFKYFPRDVIETRRTLFPLQTGFLHVVRRIKCHITISCSEKSFCVVSVLFFPQDIVMTGRVLFPNPRRFLSPQGEVLRNLLGWGKKTHLVITISCGKRFSQKKGFLAPLQN